MPKFISDQNENIVNKIRQCMELSRKAGTPEESQGALLKAQELMVKYNIDLEGIKESEKEKEVKEIIDEEFTPIKRNHWWVKQLAYIIAENFKCTSYIVNFYNANCIHMIGLKEDVEIAREVFSYAGFEIDKFSKQYAKEKADSSFFFNDRSFKNGIINDYIKGYLNGLNKKFKSQVEENGWGLIIVKDALVVRAVEDLSLAKPSKPAPVNRTGNKDAYRTGLKDGQNFGRKIGD
ncbi:MAG: hypothetical protein K0Q47_113 [Sedimentibacter sp.]|jgi:hypothetical protein|nr:hypothetical protein [Sedimentibacter sp.]